MDFVSHGEEFGFYPKWTGKLVEGFGQRNEHFQRITQGILWRVNLQQGRKQGKWLRSHYNSRETVVTRASWWQWRWREVTRFWLQFRNRADSIWWCIFTWGKRKSKESKMTQVFGSEEIKNLCFICWLGEIQGKSRFSSGVMETWTKNSVWVS